MYDTVSVLKVLTVPRVLKVLVLKVLKVLKVRVSHIRPPGTSTESFDPGKFDTPLHLSAPRPIHRDSRPESTNRPRFARDPRLAERHLAASRVSVRPHTRGAADRPSHE